MSFKLGDIVYLTYHHHRYVIMGISSETASITQSNLDPNKVGILEVPIENLNLYDGDKLNFSVVPQKATTPPQSPKKAYYMSLVYMISTQSKDESSKLGAVIIGPDGEIRSTGYNGLPRGSQDDCPDRQQAPEKYFWFEHAERNAIYNAARMGTSLKDCVMYTQGTPCADCARAIIQAGIKKVIVHKQWNEQSSEKWADSAKRSKTLFKECLVTLEEWSGELTRPYSFQSGIRRDW